MPTYQYACTECDQHLEAVQSFSDPALTECPSCDGRLRKVFNSVGIVFKGSGFYRNDSRSGNGNAPKANGSETKTDAPSSSGSSDSGSSAKPATPASSSSSSSGSSSSGSTGSVKAGAASS